MNNLNVKNYKNYVEVVNGLFTVDKVMFEMGLDDPEEFTFRPPQEFVHLTKQQIKETINHVFAQNKPTHEKNIILYTNNPFIKNEYNRALQKGVQREIERARIENERLSLQLRNMSEQQLLEHFDRISQEE